MTYDPPGSKHADSTAMPTDETHDFMPGTGWCQVPLEPWMATKSHLDWDDIQESIELILAFYIAKPIFWDIKLDRPLRDFAQNEVTGLMEKGFDGRTHYETLLVPTDDRGRLDFVQHLRMVAKIRFSED